MAWKCWKPIFELSTFFLAELRKNYPQNSDKKTKIQISAPVFFSGDGIQLLIFENCFYNIENSRTRYIFGETNLRFLKVTETLCNKAPLQMHPFKGTPLKAPLWRLSVPEFLSNSMKQTFIQYLKIDINMINLGWTKIQKTPFARKYFKWAWPRP